MFNFRSFAFLATIGFVVVGGIAVSYFARGYRLDPTKGTIRATGILVATSSPDGAQILVNGELESATNATISLAPNTYDVEIKKEGYLPWKKRITIKSEEVTKVDTSLFPAAPSLSPLTFGGAISPTLSPDSGKVIFGIPLVDKSEPEKAGLFILDLSSLPIGFSSDPRRVTNIIPDETTSWFWSPDGREILIFTSYGSFLASASEYTADTFLINISGQKLDKILKTWTEEQLKKKKAILSYLPASLQDVFERKVERVAFSPDQKRILYTPSADTTVPEGVVPGIPGSSTQKQERNIKKGQIYVYDIKEDRNFLVSETPLAIEGANPAYGLEPLDPKAKNVNLAGNLAKVKQPETKITWFPSSLNLVIAEKDKVTIVDYDGTNRQIVYSGPYEAPFAIPAPSGNRLLLLTHFGAGENNLTNLYSLGLK